MLEAVVDFKLDNRKLAMSLERDQRDGAATLYTSPSYVETHRLLTSLLTVLQMPEAARQILFGVIVLGVAAAYTRITAES